MFALRDFRFGAEGGDWSGRASSAWVLLKDRRPQRPEPWSKIYRQERIEEPVAEVPSALPVFETDPEALVRHSHATRADWEDVDMNGHVNNVNAVAWCLGQHDFAFLTQWRPSFLEVNFLAEMFCGQTFQVVCEERPAPAAGVTDRAPTTRARPRSPARAAAWSAGPAPRR